ncbi:MAG: hypothetical protein WDO18_15170 [Acidobacteriota bacterium]
MRTILVLTTALGLFAQAPPAPGVPGVAPPAAPTPGAVGPGAVGTPNGVDVHGVPGAVAPGTPGNTTGVGTTGVQPPQTPGYLPPAGAVNPAAPNGPAPVGTPGAFNPNPGIVGTTSPATSLGGATVSGTLGNGSSIAFSGPVVATGNMLPLEPEMACAGSRSELLGFPETARVAGVEATIVANYTVTPEGKLKGVDFNSTSAASSELKGFEEVVRVYLDRSDFPPGCEAKTQQVRFKFLVRGDAGKDEPTLIEFHSPSEYVITLNPSTTLTSSVARPRED